jgi:hypothetical protein
VGLIATLSDTQVFGGELKVANSSSPAHLRNASIPKIAFKQLEELRNPTDPDRKVCLIGSAQRYVYLTRPASTNVIAVLAITPNGMHASLNPFGEVVNYGDIPHLSKMSSSDLDQLWDSNENHPQSKSLNRTYKLAAVNNWNDRDVFVDLVLKNERIEKYRVRGWMIESKNDWHIVE